MLTLVLKQGRSFDEIADLLGIDVEIVRLRAHAAVESVVSGVAQPTRDVGARIIDYLLGEQSVSERSRTRLELASSPVESNWAAQLSAALAPVSREPLPAIPAVASVAEPAAAEQAAPMRERGSPGPTQSRLRAWPILASLTLIAAAVVVVVLLSRGDTKTSTQTVSSAPTQPIRTLSLTPVSRKSSATGSGLIARQDGGLVLLLKARGLAPSPGDSYAVWLVNKSADARLLGFVSAANGVFSSGIALPGDAARFQSVVITREQSSQPAGPGQILLRSPLLLH
jgi:hypothetical protein